MNTAAPKIRIQRILSHVSQDELARKIHRSQGWISRVERGAPGASVTDRDAQRIGEVLGVSPADLFEESES